MECHCEACDPIRLETDEAGHFHSPNMRMIVCAICGNKRCPHATDHRNACTNSNEVGQKGSSWEHVKPFAASPQTVAMWQYRWTNPALDTPADMLTGWETVEPRAGQTLEQRLDELRSYRYQGMACYEVRALYAAPPLPKEQR